MHPDEATEDIVDFALRHDKPFFVVPCCVFPKRWPNRRLRDGTRVQSTAQFCRYLCEKNAAIEICELDFEGRNSCVFWRGRRVADD